MITIENYLKQNFNSDNWPEKLKAGHFFTIGETEGFKHLELYQEDSTIKAAIDRHIADLNEYLKKEDIKPSSSIKTDEVEQPPAPSPTPGTKTTTQKTVKTTVEKLVKVEEIKVGYFVAMPERLMPGKITSYAKVAMVEKRGDFITLHFAEPNVNGAESIKMKVGGLVAYKPYSSNVAMVEILPEEIKLMKRYIGFDGKEKTPGQVMNLLDAVQKAKLEKRISPASAYINIINEIESRTKKAYKAMNSAGHVSLKITLDKEFYNKVLKEVNAYEPMKSVALIKRYINLDGEKQTKEKAGKLLNEINNLLAAKPKDLYSDNLREIAKHLFDYVKGTDLHLSVYGDSLAGIPWLMVAKAAKKAGTAVAASAARVAVTAAATAKKIGKKVKQKVQKQLSGVNSLSEIDLQSLENWQMVKKPDFEIEPKNDDQLFWYIIRYMGTEKGHRVERSSKSVGHSSNKMQSYKTLNTEIIKLRLIDSPDEDAEESKELFTASDLEKIWVGKTVKKGKMRIVPKYLNPNNYIFEAETLNADGKVILSTIKVGNSKAEAYDNLFDYLMEEDKLASDVDLGLQGTENRASVSNITPWPNAKNTAVPGTTFKLYNDLGTLLGDPEQKQLIIPLYGDEGSGKTQFAYQLANGLADIGKHTGILCYELPHDSVPMKRNEERYINPINKDKIHYHSGDPADGIAFIESVAPHVDAIIIDSYKKLKVPASELDRLMKKYPQTIFIPIMQIRQGKEIRGGNESLYDGGINIRVVKKDNTFVNNYAETTKNRYGQSGLKYSISKQMLMP